MRPVHKQIISALKSREDRGLGPCWLVSTRTEAALIIPTFSGGYAHWRTFRRSTIQEALDVRLIGLSRERESMPVFDTSKPDPWRFLAEGGGLRIWALGGDQ